ncbi:unnamed protein product [Protopolystoma xenopodis]|uniref:Uncharacterized protein n=1 Tax=Protopolystoma xenopodis TaxID=117903 RepID=A0A3S4ZXD5_9PLAT|nr:unnamed protein product [Protopolystoma xenopodis]
MLLQIMRAQSSETTLTFAKYDHISEKGGNKKNKFGRLGPYLSIVPWGFHPHIAILRDFAGYPSLDLDCELEQGDDESYLRSLNPKNWKQQDHYAVLGLKNLRYSATADQIRKACKLS